jgi:hypothetical protein
MSRFSFASLFGRSPPKDYTGQFANDYGGTNPWSYYSSGGVVDEYYAPTIKFFTTFKTVEGDVAINYSILEGLYRRTIMGRVIDKMVEDSVRIGFDIKCYNANGKEHKKAQQISDEITSKIRRRDIKKLYRDRLLYGDAYLYIQRSENAKGLTDIEKTFAVNSRYIWPKLDSMLQLIGWYYNSKERGAVEIELSDLIHIPRNPITGQLFGLSLLEAVIEVLNLILSSQLNLAVILDHFAVPFIHWLIDSKDDRRKTPMSEIKKFIRRLASMKLGSDIVTDSSIKGEVMGVNDKIIDFTPILDKYDQYLFITSGIPGQLLGAKADNLSAITMQTKNYYEGLIDAVEDTMEYLISDLYKPEIERADITDVKKMIPIYNTPSVENLSRTAVALQMLLEADVIDRKEARMYSGWPGDPPEQSNSFTQSSNQPDFDKKSSAKKPPIGKG